MNEVSGEYIKHFNQQTDQYLLCRPDYPKALFDYFVQFVPAESIVWDCGTGNGQAAKELASRFAKVIATDINQKQLDVAVQATNIQYLCTPAEHTPIQTGTVSLVTVAQALHWFNFLEFYQEVKRVSTRDGYIAAWCYSLGFFETDLDKPIKKLYYDILGAEFWPKERFYIDEQYQTIPFPFHKISTPQWSIDKKITFNEFIGYLSTWSAVKEYQVRQQCNPIELVYDELQSFWGNTEDQRVIHWPLHCLLAKVHD